MSINSCGICSGELTTAQLANNLKVLFGASLTGLWIGEDLIIDGYGNITSWPGRVGPTLTPSGAKPYRGSIGLNKYAVSSRDATTRSLSGTGVAGTVSVITVFRPSLLPFDHWGYVALLVNSTTGPLLTGNTGNSWDTTLYPIWTHYANGIATDSVSTAAAVYQADRSSGTSDQIWVMGNGSNYVAGDMGMALTLSSLPTAAQRSETSSLLRTYYAI